MCDAPSLDKNMGIKTLSRTSLERMSDKEKEQWKNAISWFFLTDSIKRKIRLEIQSKLKIIDITTILLAGIGLLTNALQSMFYLHFEILKPTYGTRTIQVNGESKRYIELIRFIKIQVNNLMEHIKYSKEFQETLKVYVSTLETMTDRIYNQIKSDKKPNNTNKLLSIEYKPNEEMIHT